MAAEGAGGSHGWVSRTELLLADPTNLADPLRVGVEHKDFSRDDAIASFAKGEGGEGACFPSRRQFLSSPFLLVKALSGMSMWRHDLASIVGILWRQPIGPCIVQNIF